VATKVVVVDSSPLFRMALKHVLHGHGLMVVGEAANAPEGMRTTLQSPPDLVVIEPSLGSDARAGITLCRWLKGRPDPPLVLLYSADKSPQMIADSVLAEADGFIHKSAEPGALLRVVTNVLNRHRTWFLGEDDGDVTDERRGETPGDRMTGREKQVLALLMGRMTNEEIAAELDLAHQTVKNYVSSILRKLGQPSRRHLVKAHPAVCTCGPAYQGGGSR